MKKFVLLLSIIVFALTSCEGPAGPMGPQGEGTYWFVNEYTVRSNQWELVGGADEFDSYFQYEVLIPELNSDIFLDGSVTVSMYLDNEHRIQANLPEPINFGDFDDNGKELLWTETYKADYAVGSVMFKVEYSDFYTGNRPETRTFRVVLNY